VTATCLAALDVLIEEPEIIERLWDNTRFFKAGLTALGFNTGMSESPITPVIVGDGALAMTLSDQLFEGGVFAQGIAFPTVARDKARVRTIVTATHTRGGSAVRTRHVRPRRQGAGDCVGTTWERGVRRVRPGLRNGESCREERLNRRRGRRSRGRRLRCPSRACGSSSRPTPRPARRRLPARVHARDARRPGSSSPGRFKPEELARLPWHIRAAEYTRRAFLAFTLRLSPARRAIYGIALLMALSRAVKLFIGVKLMRIPIVPGVSTSACRGWHGPMARCGSPAASSC
jgi:hypothetical protein